ncbi:MAG: hypothetical protein HKN08_03025, partial [Gammaproteobacteria bacterium]|nr:hypothetical protein [Gammaproteobacteria bacterium]
YLPLIAMNCLVLYFLEANALKYPPRYIFKPLCHISGLILIICILVGSVREILTSGRIDLLMNNTTKYFETGADILPTVIAMPLFNTATGAFIISGCVLALMNFLLGEMSPG